MRRITSVLAAGTLAVALAVPALDAGASAPRPDDRHAWSWLQQLVTTIWTVVAGSNADTAPHMDPDGFASPDPGSATDAPTDPDTGPH